MLILKAKALTVSQSEPVYQNEPRHPFTHAISWTHLATKLRKVCSPSLELLAISLPLHGTACHGSSEAKLCNITASSILKEASHQHHQVGQTSWCPSRLTWCVWKCLVASSHTYVWAYIMTVYHTVPIDDFMALCELKAWGYLPNQWLNGLTV